jgi:hypothetical protein
VDDGGVGAKGSERALTSANTSITFAWTGSLGATNYQVEINGPTSKLENSSITSYIATLTVGSYTWRVRASNANGWSAWSAQGTFKLVPPGIDWWIYLGLIGAVIAVAILLMVRHSRTTTFHHRMGDDHPRAPFPISTVRFSAR